MISVKDDPYAAEDANCTSSTVLNSEQKYNQISPVLLSIGNLAASLGTAQFMVYLSAPKKLEDRELEDMIRTGVHVVITEETHQTVVACPTMEQESRTVGAGPTIRVVQRSG